MVGRTASALLFLMFLGATTHAQTKGTATLQSELSSDKAALLSPENAYNPVPSPDGRFIAYVGTGWGRRFASEIYVGGMGRSSLISDVELMNRSGKIIVSRLCPAMFLTGWTPDSKSVICCRDRRYAIVTPDGTVVENGERPLTEGRFFYERVTFLSDLGRALWLEPNKGTTAALRTKTETLVRLGGEGAWFSGPWFSQEPLIAASPNGRYVAMMPTRAGGLWIYDRSIGRWADLGTASVSPSPDWDYMQPSWDPWFADSLHLVYFSGSELIVSSPDGQSKRVLYKTDQPIGLPVASPDGQSVAYVSFQSRPQSGRPDLEFWANTGVWVISMNGTDVPRKLTRADSDTTSSLRWLGNDALVFDRIRENVLAMHARLWRVSVY